MIINISHGSGGASTSSLIKEIFAKHLGNEVLDKMEDGAVVDGAKRIVFTTDSFVVTPIFYKGGDIGRLSICGTVNDILMMGAVPKYITASFILQTGLDTDLLEKVVISMAETAREAGVYIVAGDTKVVEGNGGLFVTTAGIGFLPEGRNVSSYNVRNGDAIILSGNLGDHHAVIISERMGIQNDIQSDNTPLNASVSALFEAGINVKTMRDVTRGGLGTVLNELADAGGVKAVIDEKKIPVSIQVKGLCDILGLDPMYMGNEGKFVCIVPCEQAEKAVTGLRKVDISKDACVIGLFEEGRGVFMKTSLGGMKKVSVLIGEGLPRIC